MTESERLARLERALALSGPTHTVADVVRMIREGQAQYWEDGDGMIVTRVFEYPLKKACHYWLGFGELRACLGLQGQIDAWAVGEGCAVATTTGRRGWARALAPSGWKPWHHSFIKPLVATQETGA